MPTRTRKPGAQRRVEIVKAVLKIIGERGLTSLTTTTLAEEVGVTTGALFRHFASREAILREAVDHALARIEATFPDPTLPATERLLRLARNRVDALGSDPGLAWLLRSEQAYLTLPEDAVRRLRDMVARSRNFLLDAILEGVQQGTIRDGIEPEALLLVVTGTIHTLIGMSGIHRHASDGPRPDPDRVLSALEQLLRPPEKASPGKPAARGKPAAPTAPTRHPKEKRR